MTETNKERDAIVKWLREYGLAVEPGMGTYWMGMHAGLVRATEAIELGEHLKEIK